MTHVELIIEAYKAGKQARTEERERTPALDPTLVPLVASGGTALIEVLDAWLRGWDEVHFAIVFPKGEHA